jgi:hypothetical protein
VRDDRRAPVAHLALDGQLRGHVHMRAPAANERERDRGCEEAGRDEHDGGETDEHARGHRDKLTELLRDVAVDCAAPSAGEGAEARCARRTCTDVLRAACDDARDGRAVQPAQRRAKHGHAQALVDAARGADRAEHKDCGRQAAREYGYAEQRNKDAEVPARGRRGEHGRDMRSRKMC